MIEPDGFLARFQSFEYALAFRIGRESLADYSITSGVSIYRRDALETRAGRSTSISVYAEDYENAMILLSHGETHLLRRAARRQHRRAGSRCARWFSQRVGWYHGLLQVYIGRASARSGA